MPVDYEEKIRFFTKRLLIFRIKHEDVYFWDVKDYITRPMHAIPLLSAIFLLDRGNFSLV